MVENEEPLPLHVATRLCWEGVGLTQAEVGELAGLTQQAVSRYGTGATVPDIDTIAAIENACGRQLGWILTAAGYVEPAVDVKSALAMDPLLKANERRALVAAYEALIEEG